MEINSCSHGKTVNTDPCYFYKDILHLHLRLGHLADAFIQNDFRKFGRNIFPMNFPMN